MTGQTFYRATKINYIFSRLHNSNRIYDYIQTKLANKYKKGKK
jgi:hypothetical protein